MQGVEAELGPEFTTRSEIYVEYLDLLRFTDPKELELIQAYLIERYGGLGLDAVAVFGVNALALIEENREAIAPDAPIIFGAIEEKALNPALSGRTGVDMTGVFSSFDLRSTLDLALMVQPDAPEIVAFAGSGAFDRQWRESFQKSVGDTYRDKPVRLLPEANVETFLDEARTVDPGSIVVMLTFSVDTEGRRFLPVQFTEALAKASAAPVWVPFETQIGSGVVGGSVEDLDGTGRKIGSMLRLAASGGKLPDPVSVLKVPTVDWRVMKAHGLDLNRLPDGTRIMFYEPSIWERYRVLLLTIVAVVAAQTLTIIGLLFQRRRYFQTQAALVSERSQLIHVSRNLRLGQLSASLAHEINQPLAAIQANAEAGSRIASRTPTDVGEIGAIFSDINDDVRRAGATIANLRRLMVNGVVEMERLDLNDIVQSTLPLVQNELSANGAQVQQVLCPDPVEVTGNGPQLQQIVLNLVLNASEAMEGLPEAARILRIATAPLPGGGANLTVEDAGPGVPPDQREDAFRPFVSSKASGLGVGLAICRSIAQAHGGSLAFVDPPGPGADMGAKVGARILLTLPAARATA